MVSMHKCLLGVAAKKVGCDTGYAGMDNRDIYMGKGIQTSFVKRYHLSQADEEKGFVRQELARVRASTMGGLL